MIWITYNTDNTGLVELLNIGLEIWPQISVVNEFQCFVLSKMTSKDVVMMILEDSHAEVTR